MTSIFAIFLGISFLMFSFLSLVLGKDGWDESGTLFKLGAIMMFVLSGICLLVGVGLIAAVITGELK